MRDDVRAWGPGRRFGLVFLAVFWSLTWVPLLMFELPVLGEVLIGLWLWLWATLMPILGNAALGIEGPISTVPNGSSDMTWNYVQLLWFAVFAALSASAWVAVERRQAVYERLYAWTRILVRYSLSMAMFSYGFIKVFHIQMRPPDPLVLSLTYGESTPGGLLWTFMGSSPAYQTFTGLAEVTGGALLLARRTTTLGALVTMGVMANVVMMNFCFNLPVKLVSAQLLLMAVFLAAHDARRLVDVFVRNKPTAPMDLGAPALGPKLRIVRIVAKIWFVATATWMAVSAMNRLMARQAAERPALYGAWEVERFIRDGQERPPRATDELRWRQLVIPAYPMAVVRPSAGKARSYGLAQDAAAGTITLTPLEPPESALVLNVAQPAADELVLTGPIDEGAAEIHLRRIDTEHARLVTSEFQWIIDGPN